MPPQSFFGVSAVFHYLGPSLAVLLFARLDVLGVAWLRVTTAAVVFALWRRPWRLARRLSPQDRRALLGLGALLAVMNSAFYLAVDRLPLSTVGAIEFLGTVILAAAGARTGANAGALALTTAGVATITAIRIPVSRWVRLRLRQLRAVHAVRRPGPPDRQRRPAEHGSECPPASTGSRRLCWSRRSRRRRGGSAARCRPSGTRSCCWPGPGSAYAPR